MNCTIVMAVYNQKPDWLLEAINSVDATTPIVLADDGSTDVDTLRALRHFAMNGNRANVHPLQFPHRGMEPTLNAAIDQVSTDYVAILDSDDRRIAGSLEKQVAYLDAHADAVACHGRFNYIDAGGAILRPNVLHPTPCHSSLVFRKSAWVKVGGYPTGFEFGEGDSGFIARLAKIGTVPPLQFLCAERRVHPASLSFPNQPRMQRLYEESRSK